MPHHIFEPWLSLAIDAARADLHDGLRLWQRAWRLGFQPQFSTEALWMLLVALEADSPVLVQGVNVYPPLEACIPTTRPDGAEPVAFCCWAGSYLRTADEIHEAYGRAIKGADDRCWTTQASGWWTQWWDNNPRAVVIAELMDEVRQEIYRREIGRKYGSGSERACA